MQPRRPAVFLMAAGVLTVAELAQHGSESPTAKFIKCFHRACTEHVPPEPHSQRRISGTGSSVLSYPVGTHQHGHAQEGPVDRATRREEHCPVLGGGGRWWGPICVLCALAVTEELQPDHASPHQKARFDSNHI